MAHCHAGKAMLTAPNPKMVIGHGSLGNRPWTVLYYCTIKTISQSKKSPSVVAAFSAVTPRTHARTWEQQHWVLGHVSQRTIEKSHRQHPVNVPVIAEMSRDFFCEACVQGRQTVTLFPKHSETKYNTVGELVVTNVWGPAQVAACKPFSLPGTLVQVPMPHLRHRGFPYPTNLISIDNPFNSNIHHSHPYFHLQEQCWRLSCWLMQSACHSDSRLSHWHNAVS